MIAGRSVLIGFADALAAPEVAASLLSAGVRVTSFQRRGRSTALRLLPGVELVSVTAPEHDLEACVGEVAAISRSHDATMPLDDGAVLVCDRALAPDAIVVGPRGPQARLALDKRLQLRAAAAAGFEVPEWFELGAGEPPPNGFALPAVLKPALAVQPVGGRTRRLSPRVVSSADELARLHEGWGQDTPALLQRRMIGVGTGVFGLADAVDVHHLSAHKRVRMMNPSGSGSSACASVTVSPELGGPVRRFMQGAEWHGMFMVELLRGGAGCWFIELNGRPWGSLALSRRAGYEYPAWALSRALDPAAPLPDPPPFKPLLCRNLGRELVHLLFVLRGAPAGAVRWPGRWATVRSLTRPRRGTTWYNLGPQMRRLFVYDTLRTLADQTVARRR